MQGGRREEEENGLPMKFTNLLVHANPGTDQDPALVLAARLAKRDGAALTLLDVVPDLSWPWQYLTGGWEQTIEDLSGRKRERLEAKAAMLVANGIDAKAILTDGRLSVALVSQVIEGQHDLLIKTAEASGANRSGFVGSTDSRLLSKCPCPLLILRDGDQVGFRHVAVALDVLDPAELQLALDRQVLQAAQAIGEGELQLVYALPRLEEVVRVDLADVDLVSPAQLATWQTELERLAKEKLRVASEMLGSAPYQCLVIPGEPAEAIPEFVKAHDIDLLVMGSLGRSGLDGLLIGNTAEQVLRQLTCSVLTLKPSTIASPLGPGLGPDKKVATVP